MTGRRLIALTGLVCAGYIAAAAWQRHAYSRGFDLTAVGRLPVSINGRVQPFDSVARLGLLQIRGTPTLPLGDAGWNPLRQPRLDATEWLLEVLTAPDRADERPIVAIDDPLLIAKLQLPVGRTIYAFKDLEAKITDIAKESQRIVKLKPPQRAAWERELLRLRNNLVIYERLKNSLQPNSLLQQDAKSHHVVYDFAGLLAKYRVDLAAAVKVAIRKQHGSDEQVGEATESAMRAFARPFQTVARTGSIALIPPLDPAGSRDHWHNIGTVIVDSARTGQLPLPVAYLAAIGSAFAQNKPDVFNREVRNYEQWLRNNGLAPEMAKARYEFFYSAFQPLVRASAMYAIALLLLLVSSRRTSAAAAGAATVVFVLGWALHTSALAFDVMLTGHPPVTNRYSTLVLTGWAIGLVGLVWMTRAGRGASRRLATALTTGAALLAIVAAHDLAPGGTAGLLRSVLDVRLGAAAAIVAIAAWISPQRPTPGGAVASRRREAASWRAALSRSA